MERHLVVMGWHPRRPRGSCACSWPTGATDHAGIVLVSRKLDENPLPDQIRFVRVEALPSADAARRSGARRAAAVVVMGEDDHEVLAIGLGVGALDPRSPHRGPFPGRGRGRSDAGALPVRRVQRVLVGRDVGALGAGPRSSEVQRQIISPVDSPSQFRLTVPPGAPTFSYGQLFSFFKARHDATVIAARLEGAEVEVNAPSSMAVKGGDCLYFIAAHRLRGEEIDWSACAAAEG
jgi:voltage-gated potassium channel